MTEVTAPGPSPAEDGRTPFSQWPRAGRGAVFVAAGLVLLIVLALVAAVIVVRRPLPQTQGSLSYPGLAASAEVVRDAQGVPQVYADNPEDLFFAQGLVQAQDRFWEMDFRRHVTAGRLSELLGPAALEVDLTVRTMGWRRVAARELRRLDVTSVDHLRSFSAGVNAYLSQHDPSEISMEYSVLALGGVDGRIEDWTPVDSLAWLKAMAWDLRSNMDEEIERARLSVDRDAGQIAELYPPYPYDLHAPIVPGLGSAQAAGQQGRPRLGKGAIAALGRVQRVAASLPRLTGQGEGRDSGLGSNSWVVSGDHTASGKPLLANDPHLSPSMPGIWYPMGLHCRVVSRECPYDVSGFTFAGLPGVVIGHNDRIAWGLTNLYADVSDLYLEKVDNGNYLYDGKQVPLVQRKERFKVAGGPDKVVTVRSTRHGPLLSDVSADVSSAGANANVPGDPPPRDNGYAVALAWTALRPSRTMDALFAIDRARGWESFRAAAKDFAVPAQNLVYADTEGNIGYQAPGQVPIRRGGREGDYPVAGWDPANDWTGDYIPYDDLPRALNPPEGFIVTANQAVTGPDYRYYLSDSFDAGYRSERIRGRLSRLIHDKKLIDTADMLAIQRDTANPIAPVLVPALLSVLLPSQYYAGGQGLLARWDYSQPADSAAAAYFNVVWSNLLRLTFHDQLKTSLWPSGDDRWMLIVQRLLDQPQSPWWDDVTTDGTVEDRDTILRQAMVDARDELVRRLARSPKRWQWGRLHQLRLENASLGRSGIGPVERLFNRGPFEVGGGTGAVDATAWRADEGYDVTAVPSMRMVVDLADLDASRWVNLTGASGHAFDAHYADQTKAWLAGKTYAWPFTRAAVAGARSDVLELRP